MANGKVGRPAHTESERSRMFYFTCNPRLQKRLEDVYHGGEYVSYAEMFREMLQYALRKGYEPKGTEENY